MIDYGIFDIKQNEATKEFEVIEQLEYSQVTCHSITEVVEYIEQSLLSVEPLY